MISRRAIAGLACLLLASAAVACGDTAPTPPTSLTKVADLSASTVAGTGDSLRVKVTDAAGTPKSGVAVTFAVTAGGGSVTPASVPTNAGGVAAAKFVSGTTVGVNTVTASAPNLPTATFSVTTIAGAAQSVTVVTTLVPNTVAGSGDTIRVAVKDAHANAVVGATVTFVVASGGGSVTSASTATDASGTAATKWITGTTVGANIVTATVGGLTAATLSATTVAGAATQFTFATRTLIVDASGGASATPTFKDANGNVTTGSATYVSRNAAIATVSATGAVSAAAQGTAFIVATVGSTSDSVLAVSGVSSGLALIITDLPRFDLKTDTVFSVTVAIDMRASGEKLGSADIAITWDPTQLIYQSDADPTSPMSVSVNPASVTAGSYLLGVASGAGSTGSVLLRRMTFKAASTAGKTGSLTLTTSAVTGATSFTDLKAKTTAVAYPLRTR